MVATPQALDLSDLQLSPESLPDRTCPEPQGCGGYEEYHPYGTAAWRAASSAFAVSAKRYRYTGMERDEETGLALHGVRMYAPWLGRWCSSDPIGLGGGVNAYRYASDSPWMRTDRPGTQDAAAAHDKLKDSPVHKQHGIHIAEDGTVAVRKGDWLSKFSAAMHNGDMTDIHEFAREDPVTGDVLPVQDLDLIEEGETLYYLPQVKKHEENKEAALTESKRVITERIADTERKLTQTRPSGREDQLHWMAEQDNLRGELSQQQTALDLIDFFIAHREDPAVNDEYWTDTDVRDYVKNDGGNPDGDEYLTPGSKELHARAFDQLRPGYESGEPKRLVNAAMTVSKRIAGGFGVVASARSGFGAMTSLNRRTLDALDAHWEIRRQNPNDIYSLIPSTKAR